MEVRIATMEYSISNYHRGRGIGLSFVGCIIVSECCSSLCGATLLDVNLRQTVYEEH